MSKVAVAIMVLVGLSGAAQANIVVDGGFEDDSSAWTFSGWFRTDVSPYAGATAASTGCVGAGCVAIGEPSKASVSQMLTTVAGATYTLQFFYSPGPGGPNSLRVLWDGTLELALDGTSDGYQSYILSGLTASSTGTQLEFLGRQDPDYNRLDDVSVVQTAAGVEVPEPASIALLGAGLLGLAARRRTH